MNLRWTGDMRGRGVASAEVLAPAVERLRSVMSDPTWVAEEPEAHLLPHIRRAVERDGDGWTFESATVEAAVLVVRLRRRPGQRPAEIRAAAFSILGSFAESNVFIREARDGQNTTFEVVTGMLDGDGEFAGHGHLVRLVVNA